jgi:predicted polyphosphate/ATP-dependent NAD kinase
VYRDLEGGGLDTLAGARCSTGEVAALGIPAGVKMYSPAFAVSPSAAGALAAAWLTEGSLPTQLREVLDVDEAALRRARVEPRLYGMLPVPHRPGRTQARKSATPAGEHAAVRAAAHGAAARMERGIRYLLGPGGTMAELARELGVAKTPLGVDVVLDGELVLAGASEQQLLDEVRRGPAKAVVSIIGGQGFLLGRGNQQLSARVVGELGSDPLLVVAPEQKLIDLGGRPLLVDTGDRDVDAGLAGFIRVVTGPASTSLYPVHAPEHEGEGHAP